MLNLQQAFDDVVKGLASQNFTQCSDSSGCCVYDNGMGQHCAWGWIQHAIGQEYTCENTFTCFFDETCSFEGIRNSKEFNVDFDLIGLSDAIFHYGGDPKDSDDRAHMIRFAANVQTFHDRVFPGENDGAALREEAFRKMAKDFGFEWPLKEESSV